MGIVGLQYFHWRYTALQPGDPQTGLDPAMRAAIAAIAEAGPHFQYLPQAVFFCALHLGLCALALAWNLNSYRREPAAWNKRQAALRA